MKLKIEIETDNAAFGETPEDQAQEVGHILYDLNEALYRGITGGKIRDANGNEVCRWTMEG